MRKILLSGYYGYNNAGDEAILKSIIENIRSIDEKAKISVLSDNVRFTQDKYKIYAVKRFNPFHIVKALLECDILISGGGTLFQDKTSTRSLIYYTSIINLAKLFGKKVLIYANGIGPLIKKKNINRVKKSLENADVVTLRDEETLKTVKDMQIKNKDVYLTTDPVYCLTPNHGEKKNLYSYLPDINKAKKNVMVSIRNWEKAEEFTELFAKICDYVIDKYDRNIIFVILQYPHDLEVTNKIQKKMLRKTYLLDKISPLEMMGIMEQCEYVISMRLHGLIFATNVGTPVLGFSYDPKIDSLLQQVGMPCVGKIENMEYEEMRKAIDDMENNLGKYRIELEDKIMEIKRKARKNYEYMKKIIE